MFPVAETRVRGTLSSSFFPFDFLFRNRMERSLFFILLLINLVVAKKVPEQTPETSAATPPQKWLTLNGESPLVIARGGFTGVFPDSCQFAYQFALPPTSLSNVVMLCDLQLSKDGQGICQTDIRLDNTTNIAELYPEGGKTYNVNGKDIDGWFALDFTSDQLLENLTLIQSIYSRTSIFDGALPLSTIEDVVGQKPPQFWLNVQYDTFYKQHKLDLSSYVQKASRTMKIDYISSPEIGFLKSLAGKLKGSTKLIFRFKDKDEVEPTTKQKYGLILENLSSIKPFASGIIVPKGYIWPVDAKRYLQAATTVVDDAHKQGFEVYAAGFANDIPASFNYSYDPTAEYLQFIDNDVFSVDGFITDFPPTASEAIACLAHNKKLNHTSKGRALIISHNGASGVYPGCTDLAYHQAIDDGVDILDCSVQMTKDGVPFCLDSSDLAVQTNVMNSFMSRASTIPEIQTQKGIFSFDLTWSEIQGLKPELFSPDSGLVRNPVNKEKGKFITLFEFLEFAKAKAVTGILVNIENAPYLASKKGFSIADVVAKALSNATFDKQSTQQVLIQSDDSAVLSTFKNVSSYKRVLYIKDITSGAPQPIVEQIKKIADAVNLPRPSFVKTVDDFTISFSNITRMMHAANISVFASVFKNEYTTIAFDFFADPYMELATYVNGLKVDGIVTEFPATASAYMRSPCSNLKADLPYTIYPSDAGVLLGQAPPEVFPPAQAPAPVLNLADIIDPPLPPVVAVSTKAPASTPAGATAPTSPNSQVANTANLGLSLLAIMVLYLVSLGY